MHSPHPLHDNPLMGFAAFRETAGWAAEYELRIRLLADKTPELETHSTARSMATVEDAVLKYFDAVLDAEAKNRFKTVRDLRNKLLHCEFVSAVRYLTDLGVPKAKPVGKVVRNLPANLTVEALLAAIETATALPDDAPDRGNLVLKLAEMAANGTLAEAATEFQRSIETLNQLALLPGPPAHSE